MKQNEEITVLSAIAVMVFVCLIVWGVIIWVFVEGVRLLTGVI